MKARLYPHDANLPHRQERARKFWLQPIRKSVFNRNRFVIDAAVDEQVASGHRPKKTNESVWVNRILRIEVAIVFAFTSQPISDRA